MLVPVPALAQAPTNTPGAVEAPAADQTVAFSADQVVYDGNNETVTANGEVRMEREGNYLAADQVIWDRRTGQVRAVGNVVLQTPQGDKLTGDNVQLTDTLRDGTIDNLMVVLESGGRLAATRGTRVNGVGTFFNAGVRAVDIRDPYHPKEIASYIPAVTPRGDKRCAKLDNNQDHCATVIQTNNVEVDDRGYIYIVDRANTGLHILELQKKE